MAAVRPMARAPQKVTRAAPTREFEPPTRAAIPPSSAKNAKEPPATKGIVLVSGLNTTIARGMAAPTANVAAEASAA